MSTMIKDMACTPKDTKKKAEMQGVGGKMMRQLGRRREVTCGRRGKSVDQ